MSDEKRREMVAFEPSARQFEMMEHAVGGDQRYRNFFLADGGNIAEWRGLVAAGMAIEIHERVGSAIPFMVATAGLALLDARARARLLGEKAKAWDRLRESVAGALSADDGGDWSRDRIVELVHGAFRNGPGGASAPKDARAIAEEIVYHTDLAVEVRSAASEHKTRRMAVDPLTSSPRSSARPWPTSSLRRTSSRRPRTLLRPPLARPVSSPR